MYIATEDFELLTAATWRAPQQEQLGAWLLRAAGGFTGRANSALAAGDPGRPLAEAVEEVRRWYAARGLPAMIAVPYPAGRPGEALLDRLLARQGWRIRAGSASTVMFADGTDVTARAGSPSARVQLAARPDPAWLACYRAGGHDLPPQALRVLMSASWQRFASVREDGETVAIGRVADAGGIWAGLSAIAVDERCRRRGLATAVTAALVAAAAPLVFLQVEDGNQGARALYEGLGFTPHHGYHYRVAPD